MTTWSEFSFILKPSAIGGIGVFAMHDIPAGTPILSRKHTVRKAKIKDIPADFRKYCIYIDEEECWCPERFDRMEIGWFINHSDHPNITVKDIGVAYALQDIKAGDEIVMDYTELNEPEQMKEGYYKKSTH